MENKNKNKSKSFLTVDINVKDIDQFKKIIKLLKYVSIKFPETKDLIMDQLEEIIKE